MSTAFKLHLLEQLGRRLNKDDLDEGLKMNETSFRFFSANATKLANAVSTTSS